MKKCYLLLLLNIVFPFMLVGCTPSPASAPPEKTESANSQPVAKYHSLTVEEAKERMESGDPIIILDVRTQQEYEEKHIPGAILVPNESIGSQPPAELPELDAEILVYCHSGNRSRQASEKLVAMGYTNIYDFGGIASWPYETLTGK